MVNIYNEEKLSNGIKMILNTFNELIASHKLDLENLNNLVNKKNSEVINNSYYYIKNNFKIGEKEKCIIEYKNTIKSLNETINKYIEENERITNLLNDNLKIIKHHDDFVEKLECTLNSKLDINFRGYVHDEINLLNSNLHNQNKPIKPIKPIKQKLNSSSSPINIINMNKSKQNRDAANKQSYEKIPSESEIPLQKHEIGQDEKQTDNYFNSVNIINNHQVPPEPQQHANLHPIYSPRSNNQKIEIDSHKIKNSNNNVNANHLVNK